MTQETFNSRRPFKAELRIIHQYTDPNSTKGRTLSDIVKEVGSDQLILDLIGYGLACDHYSEWKDHPKETVRLSLATSGYFLDHYIHDESDEMKYLAISKQPELIHEMLKHPTDDELRFARDYLYDQASPDVKHLKAYVDAAHLHTDEPKDVKAKALLTKYLAEITDLDTLTKTMTPAQLFTINHPAWARCYEPEAITAIHDIVRTLQNIGYTTKNTYADILFAITDECQNDDYHYYLELCAKAIDAIKEQVRPDIR
jgi:hypothetical protein